MGLFKTDPDCIRQREYVNVPAWHKAGYLGEGLTAFCDDVDDSHVGIVKDIIQVILPKAKILTGSIGYEQEGGEIRSCTIQCDDTRQRLPFDEFILAHKVNLINNSTGVSKVNRVLPIAEYMRDRIRQHNLIFCGAAL